MSANTFYGVVLSAAATLMGLLFFAVLFNVDRRGHRLGPNWLALARSTVNVYVILALCPMVLLLPDLRDQTRAGMVLVLAGFSIGRQFVCWSCAWRRKAELSKQIAWRVVWLLLAPTSAYAVIGHATYDALVDQGPFRHDRISIGLTALFVVALRNSWNLVQEHIGVMHDNESVRGACVSTAAD